MDLSDVLAAIALVVSMFSAWVSYRAHRDTKDFSERKSRLGFERERSEFLVRIDRSRKLFERAQHRINELIAQTEPLPEKIKASLKSETNQLGADRDYLQGCLRQAWALWDEVYDMSHDGFAHHKPRFLSLLEDDETFASEALERAVQAETALSQAQFIANPVIG